MREVKPEIQQFWLFPQLAFEELRYRCKSEICDESRLLADEEAGETTRYSVCGER
jgi:hypothetical protein